MVVLPWHSWFLPRKAAVVGFKTGAEVCENYSCVCRQRHLGFVEKI